jgi:hypothetical protein
VAKVAPFHTDTPLTRYHPREFWIHHNDSGCDFGQRIVRDGNRMEGAGVNPHGNPRQVCDRCQAI